jgi:hypothetical protein
MGVGRRIEFRRLIELAQHVRWNGLPVCQPLKECSYTCHEPDDRHNNEHYRSRHLMGKHPWNDYTYRGVARIVVHGYKLSGTKCCKIVDCFLLTLAGIIAKACLLGRISLTVHAVRVGSPAKVARSSFIIFFGLNEYLDYLTFDGRPPIARNRRPERRPQRVENRRPEKGKHHHSDLRLSLFARWKLHTH